MRRYKHRVENYDGYTVVTETATYTPGWFMSMFGVKASVSVCQWVRKDGYWYTEKGEEVGPSGHFWLNELVREDAAKGLLANIIPPEMNVNSDNFDPLASTQRSHK